MFISRMILTFFFIYVHNKIVYKHKTTGKLICRIYFSLNVANIYNNSLEYRIRKSNVLCHCKSTAYCYYFNTTMLYILRFKRYQVSDAFLFKF